MSKIETCAVCGVGQAKESGRNVPFALLQKSGHYVVREFRCETCGESYVHEDQAHANEQAERLAKRRALKHIGPSQLKAARELARATQSEMETALGLGRNVLARWETGQRAIPPYIQTIVRLVALNPSAIHTLREGLGGVETSEERVILHAFAGFVQGKSENAALGGVFAAPPQALAQGYTGARDLKPANDIGEAA